MKHLYLSMCVLLLVLSCNPFRRSKPPAPPPAPAQRPVSQPADQNLIPPPPELPVAETALPPAALPRVAAPEPPPAKPARKSQPKAPQPQPPAAAQTAPPPAPELPQLRPVLTAEEQRQLNQLIDARLARARAALAKAPDSATARQVRTFIVQCEEARKTDLLRAASLAERADLLAQQLR